MSYIRSHFGYICSALMWAVACGVWSSPVHGDQIRFRSVSRARGNFHIIPMGVAHHGYLTAPVLVYPTLVYQVGSPNNSGASYSASRKTPRPINNPGVTVHGNELAVPPGADLGGGATSDTPTTHVPQVRPGDSGNDETSKKCGSDNEKEEGVTAVDAEKYKKERDECTAKLKKMKADMAAEELSKDLGKAEADMSEATAVHQFASGALTTSVQQANDLESHLLTQTSTWQTHTEVYNSISAKESEEAKTAAIAVAGASAAMLGIEKELAVHAHQYEGIKTKAISAASAYHASQIRFKTLSDRAYGK